MAAPLSGTYTIAGTSPSYNTLADAVTALAANGVSGPVVFNIRSGSYTGTNWYADITAIIGASATNTITFQPESGAGTVTITQAGSSSTNYIVTFDGCSYVTFKNLTMVNTGTSYGTIFQYSGAASYDNVTGCTLTGATVTSSSSNLSTFYASNVSGTNNTISGNTISGNAYALYLYGNSSTPYADTYIFDNNAISNIYYHGLYVNYINNFKARGNTITKTGSGSFYGIEFYQLTGKTEFRNNTITATNSVSSSVYGIYGYYLLGSNSQLAAITGNTININTTSTIYGIAAQYSTYDSISNNSVTTVNTSSTTYPIFDYNYNSANKMIVTGNTFTGTSTSGSIYYAACMYATRSVFSNNNWTMKSNSGNIGTSYGYVCYYSDSSVVTNNNIYDSTSSSVYRYTMGYGNSARLNNNNIYVRSGSSVYNYYSYYTSTDVTCNNNNIDIVGNYVQSFMGYNVSGLVVKNNNITLSATGNSLYNYIYANGDTIQNNTLNLTCATSSSYTALYNYFLGYRFGSSVNYIDHNTVTATATGNAGVYGSYIYGLTNGPTIFSNNKITASAQNPSYYCAALYAYYPNAGMKIFNNAASLTVTGTPTYNTNSYGYYYYGAMVIYYPYSSSGDFPDIYNNTLVCNGTNAFTAALYEYYPTGYPGYCTIHNNIFYNANSSNGAALYIYPAVAPNLINSDYNNFYSENGTITNSYFTSTTTTVPATRSFLSEPNMISYNPGLISTTDLHPDPTNPASWATQGRGVQIPGNNKDLDGNARAVVTATGVPDLGAYEFTPTVSAPLATAVNTATAGSRQYFTFAGDTVCTIDWAATSSVPSSGNIYVKQYTGVIPPASFLSFNATAMYFYDSIGVNQTGTYDYSIRNYYKDPWMGTISEPSLHLAKKDVAASGPWTGSPVTISSPNIVRNYISTVPTPTGLSTFGYYTGMDVSNNAGIGDPMVATPTGAFCPGTYTLKINIANNGNNPINPLTVYYQINGGPVQSQTISTTIPVNNGTPGSNFYQLNLGNILFGSGPVIVKAWTSNPNGVPDVINSDDTLTKKLHAALDGVYTIGGTSPDYPDVVSAVSDLNTYGVCGPVTFNIRPGTYTGNFTLVNAAGMSTTNRVTFQSENGVASSVTIAYNSTSYSTSVDNYIIYLNSASNYSIKNVTINPLSTSYDYGIVFAGSVSNDSISGCTFISNGASTNYYNVAIYASSISGDNVALLNNTISGMYYCIEWYGNSSSPFTNLNVSGNTLSQFYQYGIYIPYIRGFKANYNTITVSSTSSYAGIYYYTYVSSSTGVPFEVIGNKISGFNYQYANPLYLQYPNGYSLSSPASARSKIMNNVVACQSCYTPFYLSYGSNIDIYHNSFSVTGTSYYGAMYISEPYSPYVGIDMKNNVFSATGTNNSNSLYYYMDMSSNTADYNNYYVTSTSSSFVNYYYGISSSTFAQFRSSISAYGGAEKNSLAYNPGFTSASDLTPNPNDPNSWSLQGRGVHNTVCTTDINGNPRVTLLKNGAPDIGAYEFEPTVAPPNCTAVPATATPGSKQYFMFGIDTVAVVSWSPSMLYTSPLNVKQYSGRQESSVASLSPNRNMWFYTSLTPTATAGSYHFDIDYYYKSIWLGTIINESNLMVAQKVGTNPVQIYANGSSGVNTATKKLSVIDMTKFGNFTGIDTVAIFSASAYPDGSLIFCQGDSVKLLAMTSTNGWTYQWNKDGNPIPGATSPIYYAKTTGDYTVTVTTLQYTATSLPITVTSVAPPMTQINATGALIYCTGTDLKLKASPNGLNYQWQLNGTNITTNGNDSILTVRSAGSYTVIVGNIGCTRTSTATVVSPGPLVVDLGPDIHGCEIKGQPYILDAGHPGAKYSWSTGDTTETVKIFNGTGKYTVTVNAGPGCLSSDSVNVEIDPLPTVNGISASKSSSNTYMFSPSGPQNVTSYLWIFNDQGHLTYSNDSIPPAKTYSASMIVTLIVTNKCGSDTTVLVDWATKVKNITTNDFEVSLYPNPATEKVTLSVTGGITFDEITVMNSLGQVVLRETAGNVKTHDINVSGLADGHYMIRANTTGGIVTKPFNIIR